jgi:sugar/nucleoside kinase (ribokinase family)
MWVKTDWRVIKSVDLITPSKADIKRITKIDGSSSKKMAARIKDNMKNIDLDRLKDLRSPK